MQHWLKREAWVAAKGVFPIVFSPATFRETGHCSNPTLITKNVHEDKSLHVNIFDRNKLEELKCWPAVKVKGYVTSLMYTERYRKKIQENSERDQTFSTLNLQPKLVFNKLNKWHEYK